MLKVIAQDFIKLEHIDRVMPLYRELVEKTKAEPRCISYDLFIDQKDAGHFIFIEEWPDRAALDAHCETEHFKRLVPLIDQYQRAAGTYILMDEFHTKVASPRSNGGYRKIKLSDKYAHVKLQRNILI